MAVKVGELEARLSLNDADFREGMNRSAGSGEGFASKIGGVMAKAGIAAAAALGTVAVAAAKMSMDFQESMTNVGTLLGKEGSARVKELGEDVKRLSTETGKPLQDLADGMYQVISAWGDSADSAKLLEISAKASAAGLATTEDAVNMLSSVTKGYGDTSAEAVQKVADLAFQTANLGQTTFPELAASMGKVVPLAAAAGVKMEDLFGAMATLTGVTGNTAEVSTQLRATMQALLNPSAEMAAAIQHLGFSSGKAAVDALGLQGVLDGVAKQTGGNTQELAKMFGSVEALNGVLALTGAQAADFTTKTNAMREASGASTTAFEIQQKSVAAMLEKVKAGVTVLLVSLGEMFLPLLEDLLKWVIAHLPEIKEFFQVAFDYIRQAIVGTVESFKYLQGVWNDFVAGWKGGNEEVHGSMSKTGERIHSIMDSIWKIIQTIGDLIARFWEAHGEHILTTIKLVWDTILAVIDGVLKFIGGLLDVFIGLFTGDWDRMGQGLKDMWSALWDTIGAVLSNALKFIWSYLNDLTGGMLARFVQMAKDAWKWGTDVMAGFWEGIKSWFSRIWDGITDFIGSVVDKVKNFLGMSSPSRVFFAIGQNVGIGLIEGIERTQPQAHQAVTDLVPTQGVGGNGSGRYEGGGGSVTIPIYLDGKMIAQHVVEQAFGNVRQLSRAMG